VAGVGTVWLVGMMGAGKSTVGALLARRLGRPFVDSDEEVERAAGRSVAEIFASDGEAAFRRLEREVVESHLGEAAVVALGGGAIADAGLRAAVAASGTLVYLRAEEATLLRRLGDCETRPLLAGGDAGERRARLRALLDARRETYESADVVVATDGLEPAAVAEAVARALERRAAGAAAR
jgi:shikimate kinase